MGEQPNKFHITEDGIIFRVEDTGEITELGNVDALDMSKKIEAIPPVTYPNDSKIRYSLSEMEKLLSEGRGKGFNRHERKFLVKESSNILALEYFIEFGGIQWINILITRFERGETFLEPVLHKASQTNSAVLNVSQHAKGHFHHLLYITFCITTIFH